MTDETETTEAIEPDISEMSLKLQSNWCLIEPYVPKKTAGGLHIPDSDDFKKRPYSFAYVHAVGPGHHADGIFIENPIKAGWWVLIRNIAMERIRHGDLVFFSDDLKIIRAHDIIAQAENFEQAKFPKLTQPKDRDKRQEPSLVTVPDIDPKALRLGGNGKA